MAHSLPHYLIVRPISESAGHVEPYLEEASAITGLDAPTLRQRLTGTALQVLKAEAGGGERLEGMSRDLKKAGIASAVVSRDEIKLAARPDEAKAVEVNRDSINFLSSTGETLLAINKTTRCLVVLATPEHAKITGKRMTRRALNVDDARLPVEDALGLIYQNRPVMDVYAAGSGRPVRIDSLRFNYTSLGELNRNSVGLNFPVILREIRRVSPSVLLDTGFGENALPFLSPESGPSREDFLHRFGMYSGFAYLACLKNIYAPLKAARGVLPDMPVIKELGGMLWGGPLFAGAAAPKAAEGKGAQGSGEGGAVTRPGAFTPPPGAVVRRFSSINFWGEHFLDYGGNLRTLGPPTLLGPLAFIAAGSAVVARFIERLEPLSVGVLSVGLILFIHSFILLQRKRAIENCPTSRIGTMPMGEVEVNGVARGRQFMRSPFTSTECVYYSYKVYNRVKTRDGYRNRLVEWGHTADVPFYLEDDTGMTLVMPGDAVIKAGRKETLRGDSLLDFFSASGGRSSMKSDRTVEETVIPAGASLYVMGFAHRVKMSSAEDRRTFNEKLRALKADGARMKKYDADMDGRISAEEWNAAVSDLEEEALLEKLGAEKKDAIAIGAHPTGGLFYISDRREEGILLSMAWRIPLTFASSVAVITAGVFLVWHVIRSGLFLQQFG